jgi:dihydropteroate synthase
MAGGPSAFTLVRKQGVVRPITAMPQDWAIQTLASTPPPWAGLASGAVVMGIVNVTPDSFSDGGDTWAPAQAIEAGRQMIAEGAGIVDIGGESTRPRAAPTSPDEEQRRILPVIAALAGRGALISVDTRSAATMTAALDAGADVINDVSALQHDPASADLIAERRCPVVLMHMRGTPETMGAHATYHDVAAEVIAELGARIAAAETAGIDRSNIAIDPGIGFAKTGEQSVELLQRLPALLGLGCRIVVGVSRKSFIGRLGGAADPKQRTGGSLAAGMFAIAQGATILRVHDVFATVQALRTWRELAG